jgi:hypothetical protein
VAYKLELPPKLSHVHDVFHVSQLRHCFKDLIRVVDHEVLELQDDLIKFLKVQWSHHSEVEATWEREDRLRVEYPDLFPSTS